MESNIPSILRRSYPTLTIHSVLETLAISEQGARIQITRKSNIEQSLEGDKAKVNQHGHRIPHCFEKVASEELIEIGLVVRD
jgi:hypothetical protein